MTIALLLLVGCGLPKDPESTSEHVRNGVMRVGVIRDSAPWASMDHGEATGVEAELVRGFARRLDARIQWIPGQESGLMDALEHYELDVVIGGLEKRSPYGRRVALSNAYHRSRLMIGVPPGADKPQELAGHDIAVESHSAAARLVREHDARPVALAQREAGDVLVAAPDWQLRRWGLNPVEPVLRKHDHVLAVPHGENGWLVKLEQYLHSQRAHAEQMLQGAAKTGATRDADTVSEHPS